MLLLLSLLLSCIIFRLICFALWSNVRIVIVGIGGVVGVIWPLSSSSELVIEWISVGRFEVILSLYIFICFMDDDGWQNAEIGLRRR